MPSLILRAPGAMTAPPAGNPILPDIDTGLYVKLKAADLALSDGAALTSWVGTGLGSVADCTFDKVLGTWAKPTFDIDGGPNGGPAVLFNKSQHLANISAADATLNVNQPISYAVVAKVNEFTNNGAARIIGGPLSYLQNMNPSSATSGAISFSAGTSAIRTVPGVATGWGIIIMVLNGVASKLKLRGRAIESGIDLGANSYRGLVLGANASSGGVGTGLNGAIAEVRMYNRALTDDDIEGLHYVLSAEYGVQ
jgi:hypothetical protein